MTQLINELEELWGKVPSFSQCRTGSNGTNII